MLKIYEIPIWEAFQDENCECALCSLENKSENNFIESLFGEMVMDVRLNPQLVRNYDFCHNHFEKLYRYPDKCGLAVLANRILLSKRENLKKVSLSESNSKNVSIKNFIFRKNRNLQNINTKECLLCDRLKADMDNYMDTFIKLWCKEDKFKEILANSRGLCLKHHSAALINASNIINNESLLIEFEEKLLKLQEDNLARIQEELEWFISKFDYRYANQPWKTSRDALIRTLQKLIGNYNTKI